MEKEIKRVGIVIIIYNIASEVFILQIEAIKKFCKDEEYAVEVFDNSSDSLISKDIKYHAENLGVNYCRTLSTSLGSSDSHSFCANFSYQKIKDDYSLLFYMDHDLIPVKEFSVEQILNGGHVAAGIGQEKAKKYFWPGCFMLNNDAVDRDIVDFSTNGEFRLDTGGNLYKIIEKYGEESCIFFNESYHQNPHFNRKQYNHYAMINSEMFMHFVNASGWNKIDDNDERIRGLVNIAKTKIESGKIPDIQ